MKGGVLVVPEVIADTAREQQLGHLRSMVENSPKPAWAAIALLGVVGVGAVVDGFSIAVQEQRQEGGWYYGLPMLALAVLALWASLWMGFKPGPPKTWVAWYEHGIVHRVADEEPEAYEWGDISWVARRDIKVVKQFGSYMKYNLLILPETGGLIVVDNLFDGVLQFAEELTEAFARIRVPHELARIEQGERVHFGSQLDINAGGLGQGDRRIGWREVERIDFKQGSMYIYRHGDRKAWMTLSAVGFPNLLVFLAMSEALRRGAVS